jgi:hypothetical protein
MVVLDTWPWWGINDGALTVCCDVGWVKGRLFVESSLIYEDFGVYVTNTINYTYLSFSKVTKLDIVAISMLFGTKHFHGFFMF